VKTDKHGCCVQRGRPARSWQWSERLLHQGKCNQAIEGKTVRNPDKARMGPFSTERGRERDR
jgi:hypothetical protein